jgi:type IV pilus assembly protein PilV
MALLSNAQVVNMHNRTSDRNRGFTLLEVLVALLVLSIGLLGLAALTTLGLRYNNSAYARSQATLLAYDIVDRMRSNRDQAETTTAYVIDFGEAVATQDCETGACGPAQLANYDLGKWKTTLAQTLPKGDGSVSVQDLGGARVYIVTVQWDDSRGQEPPVEFRIRTEL